MNITFDDKIALVIGGSSERNTAICLALQEAGCTVLTGVDFDESQRVQSFIETVIKQHQRIDFLIHSFPDATPRSFFEIEPNEWVTLLDTYTSSVFLSCQAVAPFMARRQQGVIINISSSAAITGQVSASFAAANSALQSMTRGLARTFQEHHVRVAGIATAPHTEDVESTAAMTVFLCSEWGKQIVGESLMLEGGKSIG
ncbi:SDR family NAD(P)-dependent oxidoreductase [Lysinibacillus piscis]|uniref:Beta-ketoacyl-ACP reductase n=1 Tax=Lysinibacillus piscis TaxID=2518931 RepID=A0ABQ5NFH4_9BACI|nr:SDR family oxidoreductase [Lysinibacillus sp. KH24]GLC87148.1 beta-ketoacyl-ACP reductase [Lysinibacillus sp. KH24]